jgi:hypothetical protein
MTFLEFLQAIFQSFEGQQSPAATAPRPSYSSSSNTPRLTRMLPHIPGTIVYYSLDGTAAFRFRFEGQADGGIRIYILEQPSYAGRDQGSLPTHRLSAAGRFYICFEPLPTTSEDARKVARAWSELTLRYVRTGERF